MYVEDAEGGWMGGGEEAGEPDRERTEGQGREELLEAEGKEEESDLERTEGLGVKELLETEGGTEIGGLGETEGGTEVG